MTKSILIAEDEAINRLFLVKTLQKLGYTILEARTGKEAVELYNANSPDLGLILMDLSMPVMDGIEAATRIRGQGSKIPIVALTAHSGEEDRKLCLDAGMNEVLLKPIQLPLLRETVVRYNPIT